MAKQEFSPVVSMTNRTNSLSKDSYMANCYKETIEGIPYLVKRPGKAFFPNAVTPMSLNTTGVGQGLWEYNGGLYAVANGVLYKIDSGTAVVVKTGLNTTNTISWVNTFNTTSPHPYMVFHDKTAGYFLDATGTVTTMPASFPSNPVSGLVYLDGYVFVMDQGGTIWQSDAENPGVWGAINYLTAKAEPDKGIGIAKHLNYLVAFKQWTTEFFYDNANATGSVLARNSTVQLEIGCASGDSIQVLEEAVIWMSSPKEGGRTVSVLAGTQAATISTSHVEKFLNASTLVGTYSWTYKIQGHTFYGLVLTDQNITLIYDMNEKEWHVWTTSKNYISGGEGYFECTFVENFPRGSTNFYVLDAVTRNVYTIDPSNYHDPFGDIYVRLVSRRHAFNTLKEKSNQELIVIADNIADTIAVSHTNDDYVTWSTPRSLNLNLQKPVLYRNGKFKRRAWQFLYTGLYPLRIQAIELTLSGRFEE